MRVNRANRVNTPRQSVTPRAASTGDVAARAPSPPAAI